jgi:hypothetical protein
VLDLKIVAWGKVEAHSAETQSAAGKENYLNESRCENIPGSRPALALLAFLVAGRFIPFIWAEPKSTLDAASAKMLT